MNTKPSQSHKHEKLRIFTVVLVVLLIAGGGTLLYKQHQKNHAIAKERAAYAQAEKDLDALSAQIIAKFGQPISNTTDKSCGYASSFNEFAAHGDLYCNIARYIVYSADNVEQAKTITGQLLSSVQGPEAAKYASLDEMGHNVSPIDIATQNYNEKRLNCFLNYSFHTASENLTSEGYQTATLNGNPSGLLIHLSCGSRPAKTAYFPINN